MKLSPGEYESQLPAIQIAVHDFQVVDSDQTSELERARELFDKFLAERGAESRTGARGL